MNKVFIAVLGSVLLTSGAVAAERSGFYLSGGLGPSTTHLTVTDTDINQSIDFGNTGISTSLKIGGYLNPNWALYYQRETSFWVPDAEDVDSDGVLILGGLMGIGATYFFQPSRGPYIEGAIGIGDMTLRKNFFADITSTGIAYSLGGGFEVSEHVHLGLIMTHTETDSSDLFVAEYSTTAVAAKVEFKL